RPAVAAGTTVTTTLVVNALVLNACLIATPAALEFGTYNSLGNTPDDATASLSVTCTVGTKFTVGLGPGTAPGATTSTRAMTGLISTNHLSYGLFQDSGHTTNWGNTAGEMPSQFTAGVLPTLLTVYGEVPAGQPAQADTYQDIVLVSVNF